MESFSAIIAILDDTLDSDSRRHIVGGMLLSVSLLFGGLAFTAMTIKKKENYDE
jgi:hypothetical protein